MSGDALRLARLRAHTVPVSAKTAWIFVEACLSDGTVGFGEASLFGEEHAVNAEIAALDARLGAEGLAVTGPALAALDQMQMPAPRKILRTALEGALLDALARRADLPVATLLGGPFRDPIPCYANINRGIADRSPEGFAARAAEIVGTGYRAIKIAPFDGVRWSAMGPRTANGALDTGLARIAAVRARIGPAVKLLVDCHGRFNRALATTVLAELAPVGLYWIEDPLDERFAHADDHRAVREAAHRTGAMVAGGEALTNLAETVRFLALAGHDVILPDLRETGILEGMAMLRLGVESGVLASLHNPAGPVLDALSREVAAALPSFLILERQVGESALYDAVRGRPAAALCDGAVARDPGPGIGFTPDRAALDAAAATPLGVARSFAGIGGAGPDA
ncbi:mandelate racemase/muconate lactonizing enzyme family protein [Acuticoccus kandeliae]|uniref:mandelate racemase/muconate lactonizing enzyme family protein n=1 Tax=Acuticoccus kandeliae TaxID=2073160 RepID=UPI0014747090|nr:enolase C-terminal domain-like protein [Acuticoccus kandeliae]